MHSAMQASRAGAPAHHPANDNIPMQIDIWSDIVCPWCYVGKRRFEEALARFEHRDAVTMRHHAFQLNPAAIPGETTTRRASLKSRYNLTDARVDELNAQMAKTFSSVGLTFRAGDSLSGNTRAAHEVVAAAGATGIQDAVIERLFLAYFTEGRSVFDPASLVALGAEAGLDPDALRAALLDGTYAAAVERDLRDARDLGLTGVPFFVVDGRLAVSGAQMPPMFEQALAQAWETRRAE